MRNRVGHKNGSVRVIVRGAPFVFRTLRDSDGTWTMADGSRREFTLDREVTFTLAAVAGLRHCEPATREVVL
jgi:hypothetical protein